MLKMNLITQEELYGGLDRELYGELCGELYGELYEELYEEVDWELYWELGSPIHTDFREYNTVC
jgi:hypothetical protein